jgi:hypothetical protein
MQVKKPVSEPSHDPLLNRFREVRCLLTKFRETMKKRGDFDEPIAAAYRQADDEVWFLSESHDRQKCASGMTSADSKIQMARLSLLLEKWTRLCDLLAAGQAVTADQILGRTT